MKRLITIATAAVLATSFSLATAAPAAAETTSATPTHVAVTLKEMAVQLDVNTIPAGPVVFDIKNTGAVEHEFVILKTDLADNALPDNAEEAGKAAEIGHVDEVDPILPGATATLAVTLGPGRYVLLCNKIGHAMAGMHASLTVATGISATLKEMSISLSQKFAAAGAVTFAITNAGTVTHEFVVLKTNIAEGALPPSASEPGKAEEVGHVDEVEDVAPGATKTLTLTLDPGKYVLICNEVGHYAAGMHASFTILPGLPTSVTAAIDAARAAEGMGDLSDMQAMVDVDALLTAPGLVITDLDRAAIGAGILPRAIASNGTLLY